MIVFLNGRFVSEDQAVVSVFDRSFLYGDGLFETMRVCRGKPFRWSQHMERLTGGAKFLKMKLPHTPEEIRGWAAELIARNQLPESILRLTLSRGVGVRGYSTKGADHPMLVMSLHPLPAGDSQSPSRCRVLTSSFRVPDGEPLTNFKTCNKLPQILARAEAEASSADEALLLNTRGEVAEAASSNLFWIRNGVVCTTALTGGVLAGVTRAVVLEVCRGLGLSTKECSILPDEFLRVEGAFLSSCALGVIGVAELDGVKLGQSVVTERLRRAHQRLLEDESD